MSFFPVICDECTDSSNKEQLSISMRYVANEEIQESFLGVFELNEGEAIAALIESALAECHLDCMKMRGQAYDGASSMSGRYNGCAAIIQQKYPLAMYSHCCSHALNLAVVNACSWLGYKIFLAHSARFIVFF